MHRWSGTDDRHRGAHIKMIEGSHFPGEPFFWGGWGGDPPQAPGIRWLCSLIGEKISPLCLEEVRGGGIMAGGIAPTEQAEPLVCALLIPWVRDQFMPW